MAAWSRYTTNKIGEKSIEIFSKEIIFEKDVIEEVNITNFEEKDFNIQNINKTKIGIMINLMKIDNNIDTNELKFIEDFMEKIDLTIDAKMELIQELTSKSKISVDYNILKDNSEEVLYLLLDLISLAKIDGEFHITEKLFIKEVAKTLNFNQDELVSLIES
jgi:tellurite resistance protein